VVANRHRLMAKAIFFEPTVVVDVNHNMKVMTEESFGPIIGIQRLPKGSNDESILKLMNDSPFGLTGGIFTENKERAVKYMMGLHVGTAHHNACCLNSPKMCWGGRKGSGFNSILSNRCYRENFTVPKSFYFKIQ